mmetsp:Transcript_8949/g.20567  ORF Transcript_8949/g.20567 Transcript_8949/m.20567 type:complete len:281 (+) Transcript_8949:311-1153(+)
MVERSSSCTGIKSRPTPLAKVESSASWDFPTPSTAGSIDAACRGNGPVLDDMTRSSCEADGVEEEFSGAGFGSEYADKSLEYDMSLTSTSSHAFASRLSRSSGTSLSFKSTERVFEVESLLVLPAVVVASRLIPDDDEEDDDDDEELLESCEEDDASFSRVSMSSDCSIFANDLLDLNAGGSLLCSADDLLRLRRFLLIFIWFSTSAEAASCVSFSACCQKYLQVNSSITVSQSRREMTNATDDDMSVLPISVDGPPGLAPYPVFKACRTRVKPAQTESK